MLKKMNDFIEIHRVNSDHSVKPSTVITHQIITINMKDDTTSGHNSWIQTTNGSVFCTETYDELVKLLEAKK